MNVNKKIRDLRKKLNYKQKDFADKIGVSRSVLSQIEINKLKPSIEIIATIAKKFNISVTYFFEFGDAENYTLNNNSSEAQEEQASYNDILCPVCQHLLAVNDVQKDIIQSLEKTISTQFQLIECLEKKIENYQKESLKQTKPN